MIVANTKEHDEPELEETDAQENDGDWPLLPKGYYEVKHYSHRVFKCFQGAVKLEIIWQVVQPINFAGLKIPSYPNYKYKKFTKTTKYWSWWVIANGNIKPQRPQKPYMSPIIFKDKIFKAYVEQTERTFTDGTIKPDIHQHSLVTDLMELIVGKAGIA